MFRSQLIKSSRIVTRSYANAAEATSIAGGLKLNFALPHETLYKDTLVTQVNLPAQSGKIGVLANHIPTVEQLTPGVVEVLEDGKTSKKFFIPGGFATMQPNSLLCVTAVEAFPLESFSQENIAQLLSKAKEKATSQDEKVSAIAKLQVNVLEELQNALK
ncbi:F1F0 ATP synthase subunit delta PWA37_001551 [Arxiozyma heterogenica]